MTVAADLTQQIFDGKLNGHRSIGKFRIEIHILRIVIHIRARFRLRGRIRTRNLVVHFHIHAEIAGAQKYGNLFAFGKSRGKFIFRVQIARYLRLTGLILIRRLRIHGKVEFRVQLQSETVRRVKRLIHIDVRRSRVDLFFRRLILKVSVYLSDASAVIATRKRKRRAREHKSRKYQCRFFHTVSPF